jgi:hypothetical protein
MDMRRFVPILGVKIKLVAIDSKDRRHTAGSLYPKMAPLTTTIPSPPPKRSGRIVRLNPKSGPVTSPGYFYKLKAK